MSQALLGTQSTLDDLFTDFTFAKSAHKGFTLLTGLPGTVREKDKTFLFVRPTVQVAYSVMARCTNGAIGGFRAIRSAELMKQGLLPVYAYDLPRINSFLVAWVSYEEHARFNHGVQAALA